MHDFHAFGVGSSQNTTIRIPSLIFVYSTSVVIYGSLIVSWCDRQKYDYPYCYDYGAGAGAGAGAGGGGGGGGVGVAVE